MIRKICIFTLVVSLAMPTFSQPARAGGDLEKFLAALTVMGLVAAVSNHDRKDPVVVQPKVKPRPRPAPIPKFVMPHKRVPTKFFNTHEASKKHHSHFKKKGFEKKNRHTVISPKRCERVVWTDRRGRKTYSQECFDKKGNHTKRKSH